MDQPDKFSSPFKLGPWLVRPDLNRVEGDQKSIQIEPRVMQVLLCLAEKPGTVLSRMELLDQIWNDTVVGEEILTRAVSELRRVFGDSARDPRYIETVRSHGYRLIAEVEPVVEEKPEMAAPVPKTVAPTASEIPENAPANESPRSHFPGFKTLMGLAAAMVLALVVWQFWPVQNLEGKPTPRFGKATPLTSYPGREWHPALSPDGKQVAFIRRLPDSDHSDLFLKQRDSEVALQLTAGPGWTAWPTWSPDGQNLAMVRGEGGNPTLCTVSSLGGAVHPVTRVNSLIEGLDWSPDGNDLVYSALDESSGEYRIFKLNLSTLAAEVLPPAREGHAGDFQPSYSADGKLLGWVSVAQDGANFVVARNLQTGQTHELSSGLEAVQGLAWTPDSASLIYAASPGGTYQLWQVSVNAAGRASGEPIMVTANDDFAWNPTIARLSGDLAYEQVRADQDLWRIKVNSREPWLLETLPFVQSTRWEYEARFSPDGQQVALVSARSGAPEIWLSDADGENLHQLTRLNSRVVAHLRWSPDGQQLAFNALQEGRRVIMLVSANGGQARQISPQGQQEILSGWAPGGGSLIFSRADQDGWQIFQRDVNETLSRPLTTQGGLTGQLSPDGKSLYHLRPGMAGLWRSTIGRSGEDTVELILPELANADRHNWLVHQDNVYWVLRSAGRAILVEYNLETERSSFITDLPGFSGSGLGISPAGDSFLFARTSEMAGDLILLPAN